MKRVPKIGEKVRHKDSGAIGEVIGPPRKALSAGKAVMVRVRWEHEFARDIGSYVFVKRIEII